MWICSCLVLFHCILSLRANSLTATGAIALARTLEHNKSLQELKWVLNWLMLWRNLSVVWSQAMHSLNTMLMCATIYSMNDGFWTMSDYQPLIQEVWQQLWYSKTYCSLSRVKVCHFTKISYHGVQVVHHMQGWPYDRIAATFTLKVHKWHMWNVCFRLAGSLYEPYQSLLSASMSNRTVNFAGKHR